MQKNPQDPLQKYMMDPKVLEQAAKMMEETVSKGVGADVFDKKKYKIPEIDQARMNKEIELTFDSEGKS